MLLVTRDRRRAARVEALLAPEQYALLIAHTATDALQMAQAAAPTVVLLDWSFDEPQARADLLHRLRPRRIGPRVIAIASGFDASSAAEAQGVRAVVSDSLDAEELVDLVWRHDHEVVDARAGR